MNEFLSPKVYASTMLKLLKNELVLGKLISSTYKDEFKKIGNTMYVKRPPEFLIREGRVASVQAVIEGEMPVVLDSQAGIDIEFTSLEETLNVDDLLKDETMKSAAVTIAQYIDSRIAEKLIEFPSWVGTPGQTINSVTDYNIGPKRLDHFAVPDDGNRNGVLSVDDHWALADSFNSHPSVAEFARNAISRARIPMIGGVDAFKTQSVLNFTTGSRAASGATLINGANQDVTYDEVNSGYTQTLAIDGLTAGHTVKAGDVFTIDAVNAVNPRTKVDTGFARQFVVLEDATADGGGAIAALRIQSPIIVGGAYATVTAAPLNDAAVTWVGTASTPYMQNAIFHKSAIQLAFAKLVMPRSGRAAYSRDNETGITIRYWETSDGTNDTHLHRWDILFGLTVVDPRLGTRISGTA